MRNVFFGIAVILLTVLCRGKCSSANDRAVYEDLLQLSNSNVENFIFNGLFNETEEKRTFGTFQWNYNNEKKVSVTEADKNRRRGKRCLKNITECLMLTKDNEHQETLRRLTERLFSFNPPLDLNSINEVNPRCKVQYKQYLHALKHFKLWALKMYDSNAKIQSGFLNGNVNQLGDFDMCTSTKSDDGTIAGRYCLASIQIGIPSNSYLSALHRLMHSYYLIKSELSDPGHRVPKLSSLNWAFCVPNGCNSLDMRLGVKRALDVIFNGTDIGVELIVDPATCHTADSKSFSASTILVCGCFLFVTFMAILATVCDHFDLRTSTIVAAFSLKRNVSILLNSKRQVNDIEVLHGIRFINACLLLLSHKAMAVHFIPFINRTEMAESLGARWSLLARAASLYTDPFIMMSGILIAYSFFGKLQRSGKINIAQEYILRLMRIVPPLGATILFCTFVLPQLNSGPHWNAVVTQHAENCKKYWWRNMLFIHNYFGFKDMCLTHTHHVGIDMQLFIVSPIFIYFLWRKPKFGVIFSVCLAIVSTIKRYEVTYSKNLSNFVHFGTSIRQLFETADNMYILPFHRVTVYIMGILLGYILRFYSNTPISKVQIMLGNVIALICFCVAFFGSSFMGSIDYEYEPAHAAWYAAFAPILWCASFAWIIFTTHIKRGNILGRFLSQKGFVISSRISYAMYLTQFPIFFYNVGITRTAEHYTLSKFIDIIECGWIITSSVILTLLFDLPFQNIKHIILAKTTKYNKEA